MTSTSLTETQRETLALFENAGEPLTTSEVSNRLDLGRRASYDRLQRLVNHDRLKTKKVGGNGRVWWRATAPVNSDWSVATESLVDDVLDRADVGIFVLDENFDVAWINRTSERYFGLDRERVLGRDNRQLVEARLQSVVDEGAALTETLLATYDDNTDTEQFECRVTEGEDRDERWLEHRSKPIESGAYAGGRVEFYYDITEQTQVTQANDQELTQFESIIDAVEEYAIFMLDPDGTVQTWNQGAERIKGYTAAEILGENFSTFYTDDDRDAGVPQTNLEAAAEHGSAEDEGWRVRADGSRFWANVTITAIRDEDGELDGYVKVTRDMTTRRENKREIQRERNFLEQVQEASPIGIGIFDTDGELYRANQRFYELLGRGEDETGYSLGDQPLLDANGNVIPYEERPAARALETAETVTDEQIRIDGPDGLTRWLSINAKPLEGEADGIVLTATDVTQLKMQTNRLERQRSELQTELDEMFKRIDDAFFSLDGDLRFEYINERARTLLVPSATQIVGEYIWDTLEPGPKAEHAFEEALETQESISFEEYYEPLHTWLETAVYPSEDGLSVYFTDISERKQRERELEEFERIVETVGDGIYVLDADGNFQLVNDTFVSMTEFERPELIGSHASTVFGEKFNRVDEQYREQIAGGDVAIATFEEEIYTADNETITVESRFSQFAGEDQRRRVGVIRDITARKEHERELQRYEQLVETVWDGVYALDENDRFVLVNEAFCTLVGYERGELLGEHATLVTGEEVNEAANELESNVVDGTSEAGILEAEIQKSDGKFVPVEARFGPFEYADGQTGRCGVTRDITDRKQFEETLLTLYQSTQMLLDAQTADAVDEAVLTAVTEVIDLPSVAVYRYNDATDELYPAARSVKDGLERGEMPVLSPGDGSLTGRVYESGDSKVFDERTASPYPQSVTAEIRGGLFVPMGEYGVLIAETTEEDGIDDNLRRLVELLAINTEAAYDHVAREEALEENKRQLEQQRESLAALNNLNRVVRDITDAVIEQSTREEIEETVCERLADSESYQFAWIGDADTASQTVNIRTKAGVDGYLDDVTISVDPDDERSEGPTGRALRTGEPQVSNDMRADSRHDPWRETIEASGLRSSAAIPIRHQGTVYGVMNVYANRPYAFDGQERAVISQLGEVVGHAIGAAERKRALMSDELVELEYQIRDVFSALEIPIEITGRITLEHAVPISEEEFLVYGTATPDAVDAVTRITEALPHWQDLTIRSEGDPTSFELRMVDPPVLSVVASLGGYVDQAVIEDSDYQMTIHLARSADVRQVSTAVKNAYPTAEMLRRHQISRDRDDRVRFQRHLVEALTDRQQTALETSYHAGFFEWPRDASGAEVAESMGVAPPTFHQHLRKAERKVFDAVFSSQTKSLGSN